MSNKSIEESMSEGLKLTFSGESNYSTMETGGIKYMTSDLDKEGVTHHDQWVIPVSVRTTVGLETTTNGDEALGRVYAGGTIQTEDLEKLGITKEKVEEILKQVVLLHRKEIRFNKDFTTTIDGFNYEYKVLHNDPTIPLIMGLETITYQGEVVFKHGFNVTKTEA
jgi:hypothetical protein